MKLCNDVITVFNARVDPDEGGNVWAPTVIAGASWYATDASTVDASKGGLVAANKATIRIPVEADTGGKQYTDPVSYANAEDVSGLWTLKGGDIVVRAAVPEISDFGTAVFAEGENHPVNSEGLDGVTRAAVTGAEWTPAKLKAAYADCVTVLGVTDNRRAPNAPHWRITGT